MLAKVKHTGRLTRRPLEAERRLFIAEFQVLLFPAMRAGNVEPQKVLRLFRGTLNLAGAPDFWRGSADGLGPDRALNTLITQKGRGALFLDIFIKGGQFVIARHIDGFLAIVFCGLSPQTPESTPV